MPEQSQMNLITLPEAAHAAGVSYWTVRRYVRRQIIEALRDHRGQWRVDRSAVEVIQRHHRNHGGPGGRPLIRG